MKTIDLTTIEQPVEELLDLAEQDGVLVRLPNGKVFLITSVTDEEETEDAFVDEIARTRQNAALMELLRERAQEKNRLTSEETRKRLGLD
jgi:predicted component of type VI protein secretion system